MSEPLKVGDVVYAKRNIYEEANEDHPTLLYAEKGNKLIVRECIQRYGFVAYVSHENITEKSFGITADEITTEEPK